MESVITGSDTLYTLRRVLPDIDVINVFLRFLFRSRFLRFLTFFYFHLNVYYIYVYAARHVSYVVSPRL